MSGPIQEYTVNYQFEIPAFDFPGWNTYYARTLKTIDALFFMTTGITNVRGPWKNATNYVVGDVVVDTAAGFPNIYQCLVNHTSASTGAFADDRSTHPTYWQTTLAIPTNRGTWATGTQYFINDFVVNGPQFAISKVAHLSGATFAADLAAGKWVVLVDASAVIPAINSGVEDTIASAATTDIGSKVATRINVTGITGITSLGTVANTYKILRFSSTVVITHNATSLILPKGVNFTTGADDILHVVSDAAGNWRVIAGVKANGNNAFVATGTTSTTVAAGNDSRITGALQSTANLSDIGNAATARTNLGVLAVANNLSDVNNATTARSNLGLAIGTNVMAFDAQLFSTIPQNSKSANYTTVLADAQKHILHALADNNPRTFTIDSNANVAYPIGTTITFVNRVNTVTIAITSDTLILAGAGTTGSRTLAANGIATALKTNTTEWMISGTGLT